MIPDSAAKRRGAQRPVPTVRRAVRAAGAGAALAVLATTVATTLAGALAGTADAGSRPSAARPPAGIPAAARQAGHGLRVTIGSVSPDIGQPGKTVTVSGEVTNHGPGTAQGLTAFLRSSGSGLQYRGQLDEYATGTYPGDQQVSPAVTLPDLRPGRSELFRMSFRPADTGIQQFGVYPLAAEVDQAAGSGATARTFLPFWPGTQPGVQKLKVAWLWPLIDQPRQGACPALTDNTLLSSLNASGGGRLGGLLQAGRSDGSAARITWAVDPALLADVSAMTSPYHVINGPSCRNVAGEAASGAARQWLASLTSTVSQGQGNQPVFATPYANVDVAALTHAGLDNDLASAFAAGRTTASSVLGPRLDKAGGGTLEGTAWPPSGAADASVMDNLAVNGVRTAVLDGSQMPPADQTSYTPDAVTKVPTGIGSDVRVLLSDGALTDDLAGTGAAAGSSPAQTQQWFLAQTAMIVAEAPNLGRSVVVAPPQRWSPPASLAADLLSETASAPWLQPEYLDSLTQAPHPASAARTPLPPRRLGGGELNNSYLAAIKPIDASVQRFNSILSRPDPLYPEAIARVESSAWRGSGQDAGRDLASQVGGYVAGQEGKVRLVNSSSVTLSGAGGNVPVSIVNQLPRGDTATVKLEAAAVATRAVPAGRRLTIGNSTGPFVQTVTIRAGESQTIRLPVHAQTPGLTEVDLRLLTPGGTPLSARPVVLKVQSTPLGLMAEVITGVAVGVLLITSIARVIRRGLREGRPSPPGLPHDGGGHPAEAGAGPAGDADGGDGQAGMHAGTSSAEQGGPADEGAEQGGPAAGTASGQGGGPAGNGPEPGVAGPQPGPAGAGTFSSAHGSGDGAGTVVTEDGRPGSHYAQHPEERDEFADARSRAWPETP